MVFLKRLLIFISVLSLAYCNIPLTKHTLLEIDLKNGSKKIKLTFLDNQGKNIAIWEQDQKYFNWYNEMGYNGNGPDVPVDLILSIKKVIISSPLCISQTINVKFRKRYNSQSYTKYLHHGSKAHMQYTFKKLASLECDNSAEK